MRRHVLLHKKARSKAADAANKAAAAAILPTDQAPPNHAEKFYAEATAAGDQALLDGLPEKQHPR